MDYVDQTQLRRAIRRVKETAEETSDTNMPISGWIPATGWSLASFDNPTIVINVPADHGITKRNRVTFANNGHTVYGIVVEEAATQIKVLQELSPGTNSAVYTSLVSQISNPFFSRCDSPGNFPYEPEKWTLETRNSTNILGTPSIGVWWNPGGFAMYLPIGTWDVEYSVKARTSVTTSGASWCVARTTLASDSQNSETDNRFSVSGGMDMPNAGNWVYCGPHYARSMIRTTYKRLLYLLHRVEASGTIRSDTGFWGSEGTVRITAICAYL